MPRFYILDEEHRIRPTDDALEWAAFIEDDSKCRVALTTFECGAYVSTIFLGLDHRFGGRKGPPLLFETMTFELSMEGDDDQRRYSSWDDALAGHNAAVRRVKAQLAKAGLRVDEVQT